MASSTAAGEKKEKKKALITDIWGLVCGLITRQLSLSWTMTFGLSPIVVVHDSGIWKFLSPIVSIMDNNI